MSKIDPSLIQFRDYAPSDEGWVYSTWLKGLYKDNQWFAMIGRDDYFRNYHRVLDVILKKPDTRIKLVVIKEDPDVILSYVVYEPLFEGSRLHWVHTRFNWARMGLARLLLEPLDVREVTHMTKLGSEIKPKEWAFNPFAI